MKVNSELVNDRKMMVIQVKDSGIGLNNCNVSGELFENLEIKNNVNQHGIGFGLHISKLLLSKIGGSLTIKKN